MKSTLQTEGMNVLQHGINVWKYTRRLLDNDIEGMKIPDWFKENQQYIISNCYNRKIMKQYTIFHDCGKPQTLYYDEFGRRHFPNHAQISEQVWNENNGCTIIGTLIGLDMMFHTETAEQIISRGLSKEILCSLLISSLAELHSNAEMFGGITSESFCIKYKRLNQRAKKIIKTFDKV